MTDYPFDTVCLTSDVVDNYNGIYTSLKRKFDLQFTGNIDFKLDEFELFRRYADVNVRGSYVIKSHTNNDCYILFIEGHSRVHGKHGLNDIYQHQTWAIAFLKCNFGRVLIRRETLTDKILELVHPIELDFDEDKPFSDTFYVLVNDRDKAVKAINRNFRNAVMDIRHDNFEIEIFEHTLLIRCDDCLSPEKTVFLAEFVSRIAAIC